MTDAQRDLARRVGAGVELMLSDQDPSVMLELVAFLTFDIVADAGRDIVDVHQQIADRVSTIEAEMATASGFMGHA